MCGIAGLIAKNDLSETDVESFLNSSKLMKHRGPDYNNFIRHKNCLLVHYRLSILDLDSRSNQPFESQKNDYLCTYNGEIYNYNEIKSKYDIQTRTTSDTEVMLESFAKQGYSVVPEWNGIFAMAILDKNLNKVHLIRDRFGVKPLYYFENEDYFLFASEAKVIYDWLDELELNLQGMSEYLWYGYTNSENTLVKGVKKFDQASIMTFDLDKFKVDGIKTYWNLPDSDEQILKVSDPVQDIRHLLDNAVKRQLISDVPLGVFLSGGIDSSALVAFASRHMNNLDTYSVDYDFNLGGESELENAATIAKKFGTNHHEMQVSSEDIADIFNELVFQYDDPFSDAANIPLYLLAKACSQDKTVVLQGDGGDELFGGYRRYNVLDWIHLWRVLSTLSYRFIPNEHWSLRMKRLSNILRQKDDGMKMALYMTEDVPYNSPVRVIDHNLRKRLKAYDPFLALKKFDSDHKDLDLVQRMLYADVDILLNYKYLDKVDKATMLCGIESRVPFLDNEIAEYMLRLPSSWKIRYGQKKYLLRKALRGIIPDQILDGRKRGFDVPYKIWLKEGLYDFAISTFDEIKDTGVLDYDYLKNLMRMHKNGEGNLGPQLWKALVLAQWIKIYKSKIRL